MLQFFSVGYRVPFRSSFDFLDVFALLLDLQQVVRLVVRVLHHGFAVAVEDLVQLVCRPEGIRGSQWTCICLRIDRVVVVAKIIDRLISDALLSNCAYVIVLVIGHHIAVELGVEQELRIRALLGLRRHFLLLKQPRAQLRLEVGLAAVLVWVTDVLAQAVLMRISRARPFGLLAPTLGLRKHGCLVL